MRLSPALQSRVYRLSLVTIATSFWLVQGACTTDEAKVDQQDISEKNQEKVEASTSQEQGLEPGFEETSTRENIIREDRVGDLMIGMPREELENLFSPERLHDYSTATNADSLEIVEILNAKKEVELMLEFDCSSYCKVSVITVLDPFYALIEGVRVGSTLRDVRKYYPDFNLEAKPDGLYLFESTLNGVVIVLDASENAGELTVEALPDTMTIKKILLVGREV